MGQYFVHLYKKIPNLLTFDFKFNVRSKGGTIYPTHMMLDYKSKNVAGWKTTVLG